MSLTLNLLTTTIVAPPSNASKWQMGLNSEFKGLKNTVHNIYCDYIIRITTVNDLQLEELTNEVCILCTLFHLHF